MLRHSVSRCARKAPPRRMPTQSFVLTCLIAGVCVTTSMNNVVQAKTYYLDARFGKDKNAGTALSPWKTLQRAMINYSGPGSTITYGDTVLLRNGRYGEFTLNHSDFATYRGSDIEPLPESQAWITYKAERGQSSDVYFSKIDLSLGEDLRLVAHVFDGIKIVDPGGRCVLAQGVTGLRLKNMTLIGELDPATLESGTMYYCATEFKKRNNDIRIDHCEIRGGYRGVALGARNNNFQITNCNIYDTGVDKIFSSGSTNILIEGNRLHGRPLVPSHHPDCIQFYTAANRYEGACATNVTIRGNRLYDHSSQGLWTGGSILKNVIFENNLIYNTGNYEWRVYGVYGGLIRNNTIVGDDVGHTGIIIYGGTFTDRDGTLNGYPRNRDVTVVNNVFATSYSADPSVMAYHDHNIYVRPWDGSPGENEPHSQGFDSIEAAVAALFVDAANDDYRLSADSPAIDFGTPQSNPGIDLEGTQRDSTPDAGCYEYTEVVQDDDNWFKRLFPRNPDSDDWLHRGDFPWGDEPPEEPVEEPQDQPPHVALVTPAQGDSVAGVVTIQVEASDQEDPEGTLRVEVAVALRTSSFYRWSQAGYNESIGLYEFDWDTRGLSDGTEYNIRARATDHAAKANTTYVGPLWVVVENAQHNTGPTMQVKSVRVRTLFAGAGWYKAAADVIIQNDRGQPVAGAVVVGAFGGDIDEAVTGRTNAVGAVRFESEQSARGPCTVTFSVDHVTHPDYVYDPDEPTSPSPTRPTWPYW